MPCDDASFSGVRWQEAWVLWRIVMVHMSSEPRTRAFVQRRTIEGKSKREIIRCLKRYVAREVFKDLKRPLDNQ